MHLRATLLIVVASACAAKPKPAPVEPAPAPAPVVAAPEPAPAAPAPVDLVADGKAAIDKLGCVACHSIDGSPKIGPTLKGYFGAKLTRADGTIVAGDETRFRGSLDAPDPLKGYPAVMPVFGAMVTDPQRAALVAYVKSL